jgi:outer membrane scaffolding protein for murein synthesis (MipA/OmpV family)
LNLEYRFNPNWSTEVGYNFDRLDSDLRDRSFTRNRVYAGVRATY